MKILKIIEHLSNSDNKHPIRSSSQIPLRESNTLIQINRYKGGSIVTYNLEDIESIKPHSKMPGGKLILKGGYTDRYYTLSSLTIVK